MITQVEIIYIDSSAEAADYKIMQVARHRDILLTQDYGLASPALGKGCIVKGLNTRVIILRNFYKIVT